MNAKITCFGCGKVGHIKSQCKAKKKSKKSNKSWNNKNSSDKNSANATESNQKASSMSAMSERTHSKSTVNENDVFDTVMHSMGMNTNSVCKATTKTNDDDASHIKFILDSGATEHMANNESFFNELCQTDDINISVAKRNASLCANQKGDINVKIHENGDISKKSIRDVLFV